MIFFVKFLTQKFINLDKHINDGKPNYFCSMDSKDGPINQNRKGENEVYYSIGKQTLPSKETASYSDEDWKSENIVALIPNYDPVTENDPSEWIGRLNKNGDIGLIRNKKGLDLEKYQASRITLPNHRTLASEDSLVKRTGKRIVRTAGRGRRYYEDRHEKGASKPLHTCYTNGFVLHNNKKH